MAAHPSHLLKKVLLLSNQQTRIFSTPNNKPNDDQEQQLAFKIPNFSRDQRDMHNEYQKTNAGA